jgi:hypothetical protein
VFQLRPDRRLSPGCVALNALQRRASGVTLGDTVVLSDCGGAPPASAVAFEVEWSEETPAFDAARLEREVRHGFAGQVFHARSALALRSEGRHGGSWARIAAASVEVDSDCDGGPAGRGALGPHTALSFRAAV